MQQLAQLKQGTQKNSNQKSREGQQESDYHNSQQELNYHKSEFWITEKQNRILMLKKSIANPQLIETLKSIAKSQLIE